MEEKICSITDEEIDQGYFEIDPATMAMLRVPGPGNLTGQNLAGSSKKNERKESDFYPTPPEVTQALIDTGVIPSGCVWEPACGDGHMADVLLQNGHTVIASDVRLTEYATWQADFLTDTPPFDANQCPPSVVTNPPFNLSAAFIQRCLDLQVGVFAMLLKSQYWHSKNRALLFEKHPPAYVMALTWRPDFCFGDRGGAPTMECIWTVWIKGQTDTRYRILRKPDVKGSLNL